MATHEALRRSRLNRLYARYADEPAFAALRAGARGLVPGTGSTHPRLMFIGEAPGANEDRHAMPFIGASGRFLNELLASVGLERDEVFITNAVKYRPTTEDGRNRTPHTDELMASVPYIRREHELLGCPPMVLLGRQARFAVSAIKPSGTQLGDPALNMRVGEWTTALGYPALPLYHPAYGLYQQSNRPMMFEMFKAVLNPPEGLVLHAPQ